MRIRNAALAGATAIAVAFGGTTVATAQSSEPSTPAEAPTEQSSKIDWQENEKADGQAIFGSSKSEHCDADETDKECTHFKDQPAWAKAFYGLGIASAIAAVMGFIGQVANFIQYGPFSK
ncbi:hypothetical protein [Corynebacterium sp.]|uniref:hypothetical protein n=1 Tax=Corynebacterium sp. TaxID=1720 RepID=UPI0026DC8AF1|nr:hypothetical protein [Corynebacterium sp.]MDO5032481.1 hypothetical protein [Corynebacterium sp.]